MTVISRYLFINVQCNILKTIKKKKKKLIFRKNIFSEKLISLFKQIGKKTSLFIWL